MPDVSVPVYCNQVDELICFSDKNTAQDWLEKNQLDTSGTPILIPFKDGGDKVHFLKPSNEEANKNLRIIGAANSVHVHGLFKKFKAVLSENRIPHLGDLDGDSLSLVDHGFIIIYEKGKNKVGHDFVRFINEQKKNLLEKIKGAQTNEAPSINLAEFLQKISTLILDPKIDIKVGMTYFFTTDKNGNQHVYRQIFKQDPTNGKISQYLKKENETHGSKEIEIKAHKSQNHHTIQFLIDWFKWIVFAVITAIGAGLILGIFIAPPIGTIAAGLVAIVTFIGTSCYGFHRADKNNPTTLDFGVTELNVKNKATFFSRIGQRLSHLLNCGSEKSAVNETSSDSIKRRPTTSVAGLPPNGSHDDAVGPVKKFSSSSTLFQTPLENEGNHLYPSTLLSHSL